VAADAARSIRNFDQMAAKDDYIHHDDLRTPDTKPTTMTVAAPRVVEVTAAHADRQQRGKKTSPQPPRSASVRATAQHTLNLVTQFSSLLDDNDDDDDGNDDDHHTNVQEVMIVHQEEQKGKKNKNRFMDDLEERLAKKEEKKNDPMEMETTPRHQSQAQSQWSSGWLAKSPVMVNVLSRLQQQYPTTGGGSAVGNEEMQPMVVGPLSARKAAQEADDNYDDEEDPMEHHTVVSGSVLGASEQAELERIRLMASSSSYNAADLLATMLTMLTKNKEFVFILFTLVLGSAAYFYSRHREEIDEVT